VGIAAIHFFLARVPRPERAAAVFLDDVFRAARVLAPLFVDRFRVADFLGELLRAARSGSVRLPVSRFHSSYVASEIFPSTRSCANLRRCAWLLNGMAATIVRPALEERSGAVTGGPIGLVRPHQGFVSCVRIASVTRAVVGAMLVPVHQEDEVPVAGLVGAKSGRLYL
jgi:hypothetical protein